jgi:thioredoxin 1
MDNNAVLHINEQSFDTLIASSTKLVLVDFWATWCPPCRALAPILDRVAKELGQEVVVAKVDVEESPAIAERFGISNIPTMIFFKAGSQVAVVRGLTGFDVLAAKIRSLA